MRRHFDLDAGIAQSDATLDLNVAAIGLQSPDEK
jgi:hypothetical protein